MKISQKILRLRIEKGMTQAEIAKIAGVSDKSISAWESGRREPKIKAIQSMCAYFHFDLNTFIDEQTDAFTNSEAEQPIESSAVKKIEFPAANGELNKELLLDMVRNSDDETFLWDVWSEASKKLRENHNGT